MELNSQLYPHGLQSVVNMVLVGVTTFVNVPLVSMVHTVTLTTNPIPTMFVLFVSKKTLLPVPTLPPLPPPLPHVTVKVLTGVGYYVQITPSV